MSRFPRRMADGSWQPQSCKENSLRFSEFSLKVKARRCDATYTPVSIYPTQLSSKTEQSITTSSNCQVAPTEESTELCHKTCAPETENKNGNAHIPTVGMCRELLHLIRERKYHGSGERSEDLKKRWILGCRLENPLGQVQERAAQEMIAEQWDSCHPGQMFVWGMPFWGSFAETWPMMFRLFKWKTLKQRKHHDLKKIGSPIIRQGL